MSDAEKPTDLFENPMGLRGFEFVEFAAPDPDVLRDVFTRLGFGLVAHHRSKRVELWRQGDINFVLNDEEDAPAAWFAEEHGPSACGLAFRVENAAVAYQRALSLGARPFVSQPGPMELRIPAITGIGGAPIYLTDRLRAGQTIYDVDFEWVPGVSRTPKGCGLLRVDHLTHNVYRGRINHWAHFYEKYFNFREVRSFDIEGEHTGLASRAMTAPDGLIRIPLNEEAERGGGQIEEFLLRFKGEGIQHIALASDDLLGTVDRLKASGVPFMSPPPSTYYEMLEERLPGHGQPVKALEERGILLDGSTEGPAPRLLLQIFSDALLGPVFFEFIQRKDDEGFGEGNFKALFESIERDQIKRGALKPAGG